MSFRDDLKKFRVKAVSAVRETQQATILELFNSVILDTPVDTGRARGNWQTDNNNPATDELDIQDRQGVVATARAEAEVLKFKTKIYLANNLPYIEPLENGHSGQAPAGMVRKNIVRIERILARRARENRV